ncbi:hypothetical protein EVAR_70641_1 [Eumeta japonica]|uniref:Uncharacterized protein n=1 Tax=Eumeta variegata TaxID=151549 RepID=A0A4C1T6V6_EUMVA|nr:hypothetical protein EVAR_70641_1 [Eumeta japonica]
MQPSTLNSNKNTTGPSVSKPTATGTNKSSITYGEYKRRQLEKKLEMERKREEEYKANLELEERKKLEQNKNKGVQDIRSQILTTLDPCKEVLYSMWKQQNQSMEIPEKKTDQNKEANNTKELKINSYVNSSESSKEKYKSNQFNNAKVSNSITNSKASTKQSKIK